MDLYKIKFKDDESKEFYGFLDNSFYSLRIDELFDYAKHFYNGYALIVKDGEIDFIDENGVRFFKTKTQNKELQISFDAIQKIFQHHTHSASRPTSSLTPIFNVPFYRWNYYKSYYADIGWDGFIIDIDLLSKDLNSILADTIDLLSDGLDSISAGSTDKASSFISRFDYWLQTLGIGRIGPVGCNVDDGNESLMQYIQKAIETETVSSLRAFFGWLQTIGELFFLDLIKIFYIQIPDQ